MPPVAVGKLALDGVLWVEYHDAANGYNYWYNGVTGVTSWHPPVASAPSVGAPTPATPAVSGPAAATLSATLVSVDAPAAKPAAAVAAAVASAPSKGSLGIAAQLMRSKKAKEAHELSKAKEKSDGGLEGEYLAHLRRLSETCTEVRAGGFFKTTSAN